MESLFTLLEKEKNMGKQNKRRKTNDSNLSSGSPEHSTNQKKLDSFFKPSEKEFVESEVFEVKLKLDQTLERIATVEAENRKLKEHLEMYEEKSKVMYNRINDLEQYSRRNSLRIFGIKDLDRYESIDETEEKVIGMVRNKLGLNISKGDIDIAHRIGSYSRTGEYDRAIIVKFVSRKVKMSVLQNRRKLKGTPFRVSEDLTATNHQLLRRVKDIPTVTQAWSKEGVVYAKNSEGSIVKVSHGTALDDTIFPRRENTFLVGRHSGGSSATARTTRPNDGAGAPAAVHPPTCTASPTGSQNIASPSRDTTPRRVRESRHRRGGAGRTSTSTSPRNESMSKDRPASEEAPASRQDISMNTMPPAPLDSEPAVAASDMDTGDPRATSTPRETNIQDRLVNLATNG